MKKLFSNNVKVFFCDELTNQNSKTIISVNDGSEEHWKSKHKLSI
jgi:hypothetical protein